MKHFKPRSVLDELYADKPRRPELHRWPVFRDYFCASKPVQVFDTWGEASTFAMQHSLYMGDPVRRAS